MPRAPRIWFPGAVYHIIQRGNSSQEIFRTESDYSLFLMTLKEIKQEAELSIYAYVLMKNHYHITVKTNRGHISEAMHHINGTYAVRFNKKYNRGGHLFQGRFKGILVDKDNYLIELTRYIHLNPIKAGLTEAPEEYKWSSYNAYLYNIKYSLVDTELVLSQFKSALQSKSKNYENFVNDKLQQIKEEKDWLKVNTKRQRFLGDEAFVENMLKKAPGLGQKAPDPVEKAPDPF